VPTSSPIAAAAAYRATSAPAQPQSPAAGGTSFGDVLTQAVQDATGTMHAADAATEAAINGTGNVTEVVLAVARAELALQTTVAIRDRVVQAYQDVMRMPI
jgi:flagellar hook-basal body complex protein FliE